MTRIVEVDQENHAAVVEPGVTLRQLDDALACHARSPEGRAALARYRASGLPVGEARDLVELARMCQPGGDAERAGTVLHVLAGLVPSDGSASLCLLVGFAPALSCMAAWLAEHGMVRADAEATAIAALWEAACAKGPHDARVLYGAAWNALRTSFRVERRHWGATVLVDAAARTAGDPHDVASLELLLADARRAGALRADQAELLRLSTSTTSRRARSRPRRAVRCARCRSRGVGPSARSVRSWRRTHERGVRQRRVCGPR